VLLYNISITGGRFNFIRSDFSLYDESTASILPDGQSGPGVINTPTDADIEMQVEPKAGEYIVFIFILFIIHIYTIY
jgi:hypothetical protein